jgi:hypothetical protein
MRDCGGNRAPVALTPKVSDNVIFREPVKSHDDGFNHSGGDLRRPKR